MDKKDKNGKSRPNYTAAHVLAYHCFPLNMCFSTLTLKTTCADCNRRHQTETCCGCFFCGTYYCGGGGIWNTLCCGKQCGSPNLKKDNGKYCIFKPVCCNWTICCCSGLWEYKPPKTAKIQVADV